MSQTNTRKSRVSFTPEQKPDYVPFACHSCQVSQFPSEISLTGNGRPDTNGTVSLNLIMMAYMPS